MEYIKLAASIFTITFVITSFAFFVFVLGMPLRPTHGENRKGGKNKELEEY